MSSDGAIVVVGASMTGAKAVEAAREGGFDGRIVLIGTEPDRPYERPPLSKEYLRGERDERPYVHDADFYEKNRIELRSGTTVTAVEPAASRVVLDSGESLEYGRLLIATGAEPRRIDIPGADLDGVAYLRQAEDSDALRERFRQGGPVAVVGAGWIGSEVAASARQMGCDVTLIEPAAVPLERVLGKEMGGVYRDVHLDQGVRFLGGTGVTAFEGDGRVERVVTTDGKKIDAGLVVVGIGVLPRTGLAEGAGLEVDNGILTDAGLFTGVEGIYAAGDVANAWHPFYDRRIRVEHWANAQRQGSAAGRALIGEQVEYSELPYFFSDQYDVGMEYSGYATGEDRVVVRGDQAEREFIAFWLQDGRVAAGMNVNIWDVNDAVQDLIRSRKEVDLDALADPDVELSSLAAS